MNIPFVDLGAQYQSIKSEIDEVVQNTLNSCSFVGGPIVANFEKLFAEYLGIAQCVSCANGTDSMEIILKAMGIGAGDEVIVPANSWISTSEIVNNVGAEPVFVDVIDNEYTIDPELISSAITSKTKAIIPVHLYGLPARMESIIRIADQHKLLVIEDCAQAHGAAINGRKVGTFGHAASFSFYPGKNLGAYGDAGCMVTSDLDLAKRLKMITNHGQIKKHHHQVIGRNSRMDALQAAVLTAKLPYLDKWIAERNRNAKKYIELLPSGLCPTETAEGSYHGYHLFVLRTTKREKLIESFKEAGIGYGIHYPTILPLLEVYAYMRHTAADFPVAYGHSSKIISIPMFPELTSENILSVSVVIEKCLSEG